MNNAHQKLVEDVADVIARAPDSSTAAYNAIILIAERTEAATVEMALEGKRASSRGVLMMAAWRAMHRASALWPKSAGK